MSEIYIGVKFQHINLGIDFETPEMLTELKKTCALFFDKNMAPPYHGGSSGNLSFRLKPNKNSFIITASHTALKKEMGNFDFCLVTECNLEKNTVKYFGSRVPSSESMMHSEIYRLRPEINAVLHGHSDEILQIAKKLNLPTTAEEAEYGTKSLALGLVDILKNHNFLILKNHGFISLGKTISEAEKKLENVKIRECGNSELKNEKN
jgi:L-fuculose-phosphate aldolase